MMSFPPCFETISPSELPDGVGEAASLGGSYDEERGSPAEGVVAGGSLSLSLSLSRSSTYWRRVSDWGSCRMS